ncbi:MAG: helix-turn-helix transcriptional regulator [Pseudoxanthomonas sp.]|nr:helix-turn-helix transcriptional regulator [Pseudoxanthomonas sp.]
MKHDQVMARLGAVIRARREALELSQEAFADRIEMHRTYYSAIERGEKNIQLSTLLRVCQGLGVTVEVVCGDCGI